MAKRQKNDMFFEVFGPVGHRFKTTIYPSGDASYFRTRAEAMAWGKRMVSAGEASRYKVTKYHEAKPKRNKPKRISAALTRYLRKMNPGKMKGVSHVRVKKLKGGGLTITPVQGNGKVISGYGSTTMNPVRQNAINKITIKELKLRHGKFWREAAKYYDVKVPRRKKK